MNVRITNWSVSESEVFLTVQLLDSRLTHNCRFPIPAEKLTWKLVVGEVSKSLSRMARVQEHTEVLHSMHNQEFEV